MAIVQKEPSSVSTAKPSLLPVPATPASLIPYRRPPGKTSGGSHRFALVACLLVFTLILGGLAFLFTVLLTPGASIVIVPAHQSVQASIQLEAVPGHASSQQVRARLFSAAIPAQTTTVPATGIVDLPTLTATGQITFLNIAPFAQYVRAGSTLTTRNGVQVMTLAQAQIPAGNAPEQGSATVPARAVSPGASGNIPAFALNDAQCCDNGVINGVVAINSKAFSGGQDAASYTTVQQADVTNAAAPLLTQVAQQEQPALLAQLRAGEVLVANSRCTPSVQASPKVGTRAAQVSVSVSATCTGEVYNGKDVERLGEAWLLSQPTTGVGTWRIEQIGPGLVVVRDTKGTLTITTPVRGTWTATIDRAAIQRALQHIAGLPTSRARALLLQIPGVAQVQINGTLPPDAGRITYTIQGEPASP